MSCLALWLSVKCICCGFGLKILKPVGFCFPLSYNQGSKKVLSGRPGQVDFCVGQVTFPTHLPDGQGCEHATRELS